MSKVDRAMLRGRPLVMELLNEYRESECAIKEDRVTYYADRLDGRTEDERMDERTKTEQNGVGITDELRKWIDTIEWFEDSVTHKNILTIADHIDERYRRGMATAQQVGINEGEDAAMREGWVKLPIDADGVPIRVGDVVEYGGSSDKVTTLSLWDGGWNLNTEYDAFEYKRVEGYEYELIDHPELFRHVQPDSWERIIEDVITVGWPNDSWGEVASTEIHDELVERCRRLAGDAE